MPQKKGDIELPLLPGQRRDPRLPPKAGVLGRLKQSAKGLEALKNLVDSSKERLTDEKRKEMERKGIERLRALTKRKQ